MNTNVVIKKKDIIWSEGGLSFKEEREGSSQGRPVVPKFNHRIKKAGLTLSFLANYVLTPPSLRSLTPPSLRSLLMAVLTETALPQSQSAGLQT
jgi:hypothetical protein